MKMANVWVQMTWKSHFLFFFFRAVTCICMGTHSVDTSLPKHLELVHLKLTHLTFKTWLTGNEPCPWYNNTTATSLVNTPKIIYHDIHYTNAINNTVHLCITRKQPMGCTLLLLLFSYLLCHQHVAHTRWPFSLISYTIYQQPIKNKT